MTRHDDHTACSGDCITRRSALLRGAGVITGTVLLCSIPGCEDSEPIPVQVTRHPGKLIGTLSALNVDEPVAFAYPDDSANTTSMLVRLGVPAGGGIGPDKDVVAFNMACPHMGGALFYAYRAEEKAVGPCPNHLTAFDLLRHGMVIAGHATASLPQVLLELDGDDVYAVGLIGLIYGHHCNPDT
ncbi:MAG: arsenate reductase (azurin) small subunit [Planctomycetes bacterium]|nr:arsenate reductase (azurin) small subunit [Planctomycetota bacterium]